MTAPVAKLFSIVPSLLPTSPPDVPDLPPVTVPVAQENEAPVAHTELRIGDVLLVMVPPLRPTSPPAKAKSLALLVTLPNACELLMVESGAFEPTRPPAAAFVPEVETATSAEDPVIDAVPRPRIPFWPASPPTKLAPPPLTVPVARELLMVDPAAFEPTRPPAILRPPSQLPWQPSATVTVTAVALELLIDPATCCGPNIPFCPTSPPVITPVSFPPSTLLLLTLTLLMVPAFWPASTPTNWPGPPALGFALTVKSVRLRLRTVPVAPMVPNRPILFTPSAVGEITALLMAWPWPSSRPVNGDPALPIGSMFLVAMSVPSA